MALAQSPVSVQSPSKTLADTVLDKGVPGGNSTRILTREVNGARLEVMVRDPNQTGTERPDKDFLLHIHYSNESGDGYRTIEYGLKGPRYVLPYKGGEMGIFVNGETWQGVIPEAMQFEPFNKTYAELVQDAIKLVSE